MKNFKVKDTNGDTVKSFKNRQEALAFARRNAYDVEGSKSAFKEDRKSLREAKRIW
jgi:hypothetical protein